MLIEFSQLPIFPHLSNQMVTALNNFQSVMMNNPNEIDVTTLRSFILVPEFARAKRRMSIFTSLSTIEKCPSNVLADNKNFVFLSEIYFLASIFSPTHSSLAWKCNSLTRKIQIKLHFISSSLTVTGSA